MAKPKVLPTPEGREIVLKSRQAKFTNLNLKPEASGKDLIARADLSIEFLVADKDVAQVVHVEEGVDVLEILWNSDGDPRLLELGGAFELDFKAQGSCRIGPLRGEGSAFDVATLKKITVAINLKHELVVHAQLRVDPTGELEMLQRLQLARTCKFSFKGAVLVNAGPDEDDPNDDGQDRLPL